MSSSKGRNFSENRHSKTRQKYFGHCFENPPCRGSRCVSLHTVCERVRHGQGTLTLTRFSNSNVNTTFYTSLLKQGNFLKHWPCKIQKLVGPITLGLFQNPRQTLIHHNSRKFASALIHAHVIPYQTNISPTFSLLH